MFKKSCAALLAALLCGVVCGCGKSASADPPDPYTGYTGERVQDTRDLDSYTYTTLNLSATDDYGRALLPQDGVRDDKYVGMFYFLNLGQDPEAKGIYDVTDITDGGAAPENFFGGNTEASPVDAQHFWGKPVFGYYNSQDEWVMRKQIEMLTLMGVDFLVLDCTNNRTYDAVAQKLFDTLADYQSQGWNVPRVMYYIRYDDDDTRKNIKDLKNVYTKFYTRQAYKNLWFAPNGKPLATLHEKYYITQGAAKDYGFNMQDSTEKAMRDYFEFRCSQWPTDPSAHKDGVPWMDFTYPQHNYDGWMNISVAQHSQTVTFSSCEKNPGRGYTFGGAFSPEKNDHARYGEDLNLQAQFNTAIEHRDELDCIFLTGWNEWIATKHYSKNRGYHMVDTFNAEYMRDIEPSETCGDNTFLLTAQKIRAFNYSAAKHYAYPSARIDIETDDAAWQTIPAFADFTGDCRDRDSGAMSGRERYTDTSGRNDIESVKIARDETYLYFRITAAADITAPEANDPSYMNIWLKTANGAQTACGYHYVLNRRVAGNTTYICAAADGKWRETGKTGYVRTSGNTMFVRVKLADLGLSDTNYDIECKVTDGCDASYTGDFLDFYRSGDCAPIGRLNYRYGY